MSKPLKLAGLVLALVPSVAAFALEVSGTQVQESDTRASWMDENTWTQSMQARSRSWGLSRIEWQRYEQLMQGIRGSISPSTISPIEVLGIHARDTDERRRYAEMWTRILREDVSRILAFQHAYNAATKRLYPDEPLIDINRLPARTDKAGALREGDRVLFFTRADCAACDALLEKLLPRMDAVAGIDIYIAGVASGDDQAVRDWALTHSIKPEWVRSARVTLNHEAGVLKRLTQGKGRIPYILRRQGKDLSVLRAAQL